jgi:hypothetical protein
MSSPRESAERAVVDIASGVAARHVVRVIQDAALRSIDAGAVDRLTSVDRGFDAAIADAERAAGAAPAAPAARPPLWDVGAMFAAVFAGGLAINAGQVISRTGLGRLDASAPFILGFAAVSAVLLLLGLATGRGIGGSARAIVRALTALFAIVGAIGVFVRLLSEVFVPLGVAALIVLVGVVAVAVVAAVRAGRRPGPSDFPPASDPSARARNEVISASEDAQDRAHAVLDSVWHSAHPEFAEAARAGVTAAVRTGVLSAADARRLRRGDWAAARYDVG